MILMRHISVCICDNGKNESRAFFKVFENSMSSTVCGSECRYLTTNYQKPIQVGENGSKGLLLDIGVQVVLVIRQLNSRLE
jgi:hypothetical protein